MATVYLGLITLLSEFGLGSAIVYLRNLTDEQIAQLNTLSVVLGIAGFGVSCAVAFPLSLFFKSPKLTWVVVVMGIAFIISAFQIIPYGLFQRDKAFRLLAIVDSCRAITQAFSIVALAILGFGYWSLVLGGLLGSSTSTGILLVWRSRPFARPALGSIRQAIVFSRDIIVSRMSWYVYSNSDFVVAGRMLGQGPLGAYTVAWNLSSTATEKVTDLIARVMPSFVSEAQTEPAILRRYVRNLTEGISLLTFPATLGLALVSREFVLLALGKKWEGAVAPLQLLALYALIRSITTLFGPVLSAVDIRWASRYGLSFVVVFPAAFYIGSRWGAVGIAAGWVCLYPVMYIPIYRHVFNRIEMTLNEYLRAIWPAISASLTMATLVWILKLGIPPVWPLYLRFTTEVVIGASVYLITLSALHRERLKAFLRLIRSAVH